MFILQMSKLRLSEGKETEVHKVTKPESVEAGLIFSLLMTSRPSLLPLSLAGSHREQVRRRRSNIGTKALRVVKYKRQVQRRWHLSSGHQRSFP